MKARKLGRQITDLLHTHHVPAAEIEAINNVNNGEEDAIVAEVQTERIEACVYIYIYICIVLIDARGSVDCNKIKS